MAKLVAPLVAGPVRSVGRETGVELWVGTVGGQDLVRDYIAGAERASPFFAGHPSDPGAFRARAVAVQRRLGAADRARIREALRPSSPAAAAKLEQVLAGNGLAVTTGQQTGLFGGPLYTVYKLLTAVRLARSLEPVLDVPVLPVFWMASDDHDWVEANVAAAVDARNELRRIRLEGDEDPQVAMSERVLGPEVTAAVEAWVELLPASEFAAPLVDLVRRAYVPAATMAGAFGELLLGLLGDFDFALLDPAHPAVKQAASPILARELEHFARHAGVLSRQSERLSERGYHAQVTIAADAANVFLHGQHGRDRLALDAGSWVLRRTKQAIPAAELMGLVRTDPARFSPNVLLRPVVESALLPTVAYVGGPAEISYFAQIGCLFRAHGLEPPVVVPRRSVTVVEGKVRKVLDKFGLEPADLGRPFHEVTTEVLHGELADDVTAPLDRLRQAIGTNYEALAEGAAAIDPTLRKWVLGLRNKALGQADSAEKKLTSHLKKRSQIEIEQLRKAAVHLHPEGTAQERVLNVLPLLARYGPGLLRDVADAIRVDIDRPVPGWSGVDCGEHGTGLPSDRARE